MAAGGGHFQAVGGLSAMRDQFSTIDGLPAVIRKQMIGICETFSGTLGGVSGTDDELSGADDGLSGLRGLLGDIR
ncbi:MAG: hypothetical protein KKG02_08705 [Candidatus Edwardsbacteria bacterium]|nr:hypothetical protein [Candidatus Edwardsbacteria bacterium]MBU2594610.1 hypothetical protein [Candidatus Edwardsbacteria bacterium]